MPSVHIRGIRAQQRMLVCLPFSASVELVCGCSVALALLHCITWDRAAQVDLVLDIKASLEA